MNKLCLPLFLCVFLMTDFAHGQDVIRLKSSKKKVGLTWRTDMTRHENVNACRTEAGKELFKQSRETKLIRRWQTKILEMKGEDITKVHIRVFEIETKVNGTSQELSKDIYRKHGFIVKKGKTVLFPIVLDGKSEKRVDGLTAFQLGAVTASLFKRSEGDELQLLLKKSTIVIGEKIKIKKEVLARLIRSSKELITKPGYLLVKEKKAVDGVDCVVLQLKQAFKKNQTKQQVKQRAKVNIQYQFIVDIQTRRVLKLEVEKKVENSSYDKKSKMKVEYEGGENGTVKIKYFEGVK